MAQTCLGLAAATGGDYMAAEGFLAEALDVARRSKSALEFEARLLAHLADTHERAGHKARALDVAREAIDVARRRTDRLGECHATIVAVAAHDNEDTALLERARELLRVTSAAILEPIPARSRASSAF
jgi:adenylate cyclase